MTTFIVQRSVRIAAPAALVRQQFGDVAHHAESSVHKGITFEVLQDDGTTCRYRQATKFGPFRFLQEFTLHRPVDGPLVNTITRGQFAGGSISFNITAADADTGGAQVIAELSAELRGVYALTAPILRRKVGNALASALEEDRTDIESGSYLRSLPASDASQLATLP